VNDQIVRRKNGHEEASKALTLPPDRAKTVEAGLLMFQEISAERDRLRRELEESHRERKQDRVELEALRSLVATLESRASSHQLERDQAVGDRAVYEALFISIDAQLRAFEVPIRPVVKKLADMVTAQNDANQTAQQADNNE
jgi:hypothetical protein